MLIAVETIDLIEKAQEDLADFRERDREQRWLATSNWSEDPSWGVDITLLNNGCPPPNDIIQNVVLSTDPGDIHYMEPKDRKTLVDVDSLDLPPP